MTIARSRDLAALSAEPLFAVNHEQRIVAWNGAAADLFGNERSDVLGRFCYELVEGRNGSGHRVCREGCAVMASATHGKAMPPMVVRTTGSDGSVTLDISTIVIYASDGVGSVLHLCRPANAGATDGDDRPRLTSREQQVLRCLCEGDISSASIARRLGISPSTARNEVQRLLEKLGAHSRGEVIALAYRDNLLT